MPLPDCAPRRALHRRGISFEGFIRHDGLWEVEGYLHDHKPFDFRNHREDLHPAGQPVHDMAVRVTLNDINEIVDICAFLAAVPYGSCQETAPGLSALIGCTIGPGWRNVLRAKLPRRLACTHLSELLLTLATVVFQTRGFGKAPEGSSPLRRLRDSGERPFFVDKCLSWREDGELVRQVFPSLHRPG